MRTERSLGFPLVVTVAALLGCKSMSYELATEEARDTLSRMVKDVETTFHREGATGPSHELPATTSPVPPDLEVVAGHKTQPNLAAWEAWSELGFSLVDPQWCQYQWVKQSESAGRAIAKCDPDGDHEATIHYEWAVTISSQAGSKTIEIAPELTVVDD